ncbi:MAG: elongation factor 4 [Verrucomicrobia bacterium]|jgi:GTP-binding protein LepA|nr:elongation factor 4 [Verrucomicrobiota bacterium]MBT7066655.1 elongation factor 4 [Verrucomicrobiota bacterium]MBT7699052.1 elongation factor 4 [Verrucomicrobiota bacterium]
MPDLDHIRNFCIIAHIDHGKSTLADRMMQQTQTVDDRGFRDQMLDDMDLERERGITIKSHPVTMTYCAEDGEEYELNLIDTPGHVDFAYEVSRSMAACEGALLIVDAAQGVEAQTVANTYLAMDHGLEIIPVINKIDLPSADIPTARRQIEDVLAIESDEAYPVSAKTGEGVGAILEAIVQKVPPPQGDAEGKTNGVRALVFDSHYDKFRGVVAYLRVVDGSLKIGDRMRFMASGVETELKEVGVFEPGPVPIKTLKAGGVGYAIGTLKDVSEIKVGDTVTTSKRTATEKLEGFKEVKPMVFTGIYPVDTADFDKFRQSLEKLSLNDCSFTYHPESSTALGFGFRCGFLGLLHMEIIQERLRREFDLDIISTHPSVIYRVMLRNGELMTVDNPIHLPDRSRIAQIEEPLIKAFIISQNEHIGDIMRLVMERRGECEKTESLDTQRVMMTCMLPLNEILTDFHDHLKSVSRGYASMDYEYAGYQVSPIVKMDILLNSEVIDAFSSLVHESRAIYRGRLICKALKDEIPPHMFSVPVQATLGGSIIARETIRAFRKDVTAKLYGGDVTRKRKLLDKQKKGKKRMKQFGSVSVPQKAFVAVLKNG